MTKTKIISTFWSFKNMFKYVYSFEVFFEAV